MTRCKVYIDIFININYSGPIGPEKWCGPQYNKDTIRCRFIQSNFTKEPNYIFATDIYNPNKNKRLIQLHAIAHLLLFSHSIKKTFKPLALLQGCYSEALPTLERPSTTYLSCRGND